jgi:tetratricopeptide (TPR) repeat protein
MKVPRQDRHVDPRKLQALIDKTPLSALDRRDLIDHLLTGCPACLELARSARAEFFKEVDTDSQEYAGVLRRLELAFVLASSDVDVERNRGEVQWKLLAGLDQDARLTHLKDDPALRHWGLFNAVSEAVRIIWRHNPHEAVDAAYFGLQVVASLDAQSYGEDNINDFFSNAYTLLAGAKRRAGDFPGAQEAAKHAYEHLRQGTGDKYEQAEIIKAESLILRDLGNFEEAVSLLDQAARIYRSYRDLHAFAKVTLQQASTIGHADPLRGIELCTRGLQFLDRSKADQFVELSAMNNLAWFQNDAGFVAEARNTLTNSRHLYQLFADAATELRLLWLDARIAKNEGRLAYAEAVLTKAKALASNHGMNFERTLISVDLCEILMSQGRIQEALPAIRAAISLLGAHGCNRDAQALILRAQLCLEANQLGGVWQYLSEAVHSIRRGWNGISHVPKTRILA